MSSSATPPLDSTEGTGRAGWAAAWPCWCGTGSGFTRFPSPSTSRSSPSTSRSPTAPSESCPHINLQTPHLPTLSTSFPSFPYSHPHPLSSLSFAETSTFLDLTGVSLLKAFPDWTFIAFPSLTCLKRSHLSSSILIPPEKGPLTYLTTSYFPPFTEI